MINSTNIALNRLQTTRNKVMKITAIIFTTITCLYTSSAYAGGFNSFAYGFSQAQQQKQQNQIKDNASNSTGITHGDVDVLIAQYKACLESTPPMAKSHNTTVKKKVEAEFSKTEKAKKNLIENYKNGKMTDDEFQKRWSIIVSTHKTKLLQIKKEFDDAFDANYEAQKQFCSTQLENQKQQIKQQRAMQVVQQRPQQRAIQRQPLANQNNDSDNQYWLDQSQVQQQQQEIQRLQQENEDLKSSQ